MSESKGQVPGFEVMQVAGEIEPDADGGYAVHIDGETFQAADVAEALAMLAEAAARYEMSMESEEELEL
jgi:predicted RNase H-like HicB family nuclease